MIVGICGMGVVLGKFGLKWGRPGMRLDRQLSSGGGGAVTRFGALVT